MTSAERLTQQREQYGYLSNADLLNQLYRAMEKAICRMREAKAQLAAAEEDYSNLAVGIRALEEHMQIGGGNGNTN